MEDRQTRIEQGHIIHAGWLRRARRLIEGAGGDCAECGYLPLPVALEQAADGRHEAAGETAAAAGRIAERFGDADHTRMPAGTTSHGGFRARTPVRDPRVG